MQHKTKAMWMGSLVLASIIAFIIIAVEFVSAERLNKKNTFILFFSDTLTGLDIGSKVTYRGIKVGEVTKIKLIFDPKNTQPLVPVYIQFLHLKTEGLSLEQAIEGMIKNGLRANIVQPSLLINEKNISLAYFPNTPVLLHTNNEGYTEIPTIPTTSQLLVLTKALETAQLALTNIGHLVSTPELQKSLTTTLGTLHIALENVNRLAASPELQRSLHSVDVTMQNANKLVNNVDNYVQPLLIKLMSTVDELKQAAYSLKTLTEYLSRHPESVILGKGNPKP